MYDDERVSFGPYVLDRNERTLERHCSEIALPERSLRLLEILVRSAGQTVTKDRLVEEVWQGAYVSDTSLTEAMSRLRHTLGDEAREPRYIRTVHGRGYRFITPIKRVGNHSGSGTPTKRVWTAIGIAASIALIAVLWIGSVVVDDRHAPDRITRYRLAEVTMNGAQFLKYGIPALPLNDLSVDRRGHRLAFSIADGHGSDAWVLEPRTGKFKRITSGGDFTDPVWTPDGQAVALAHSRNGNFDLVLKEVDRDRPAQVLLEAPLDQFPESWSQDGSLLIYSERHPETGYDLWLLQQHGDNGWMPRPLVRTPNDEAFGAISPDGRYVAYMSTTGQLSDVFVVDLTSDRTTFRVSRNGGAYPFWSFTGDNLHYVKGDEVWTIASDQIGDDLTRTLQTSTTVPGLYLAGSVSAADRFVVAALD